MKNTTFKKVILTTVVSVGLATPLIASNTNIVPFGQTAIVEAAAKKITLKHNAYLYNYIGHRIGRGKLYRHHSYRYYSVKYIHGKKYYRVDKNRYVKASNVAKLHSYKVEKGSNTTSSSTTKINTDGMGTPKFQVKIDNNNIDIYSASHAIPHGSWINSIPLHGTYNVYAEENDMYEIGKDQWVNEIDTDSVVSDIASNNVNGQKSSQSGYKYSASDLTSTQKQEVVSIFLSLVNQARASKGVAPLKLDTSLSDIANRRSIHDANTLIATGDEDDHVDSNGNSLVPDGLAEVESGVLTPNSSTKEIANYAFDQFTKRDSYYNWEHKKILLSPDYTEIGIGVTFPKGFGIDPDASTIPVGSLVADLK
ncbi:MULTISPECIES: CAP domain-containing protein [unclassified Lactobacillus]|uniref:CAP domain-containing protein n=1 Tax=unclassified Lactobacillus TaxID=2620435 RepID=UPI000EFB123C|nr:MULTISPECIES: CAP domain-containing protein [unclassified Lactobacillus]RMC23848.1 hypothetical protein F5ESL0247_06525 [Lactobacillus sp. ESL0247]RMC27592.1 hypothetical protein F5ESL0246_06525 [Lactobacillus sp. ESL0246]RMC30872.1 hypothetical protein F5ESL0245_06530 [Lactobacillus sp. ESL0245]